MALRVTAKWMALRVTANFSTPCTGTADCTASLRTWWETGELGWTRVVECIFSRARSDLHPAETAVDGQGQREILQPARDLVGELLEGEGSAEMTALEAAAHTLAGMAYDQGSTDNIAAVLVNFTLRDAPADDAGAGEAPPSALPAMREGQVVGGGLVGSSQYLLHSHVRELRKRSPHPSRAAADTDLDTWQHSDWDDDWEPSSLLPPEEALLDHGSTDVQAPGTDVEVSALHRLQPKLDGEDICEWLLPQTHAEIKPFLHQARARAATRQPRGERRIPPQTLRQILNGPHTWAMDLGLAGEPQMLPLRADGVEAGATAMEGATGEVCTSTASKISVLLSRVAALPPSDWSLSRLDTLVEPAPSHRPEEMATVFGRARYKLEDNFGQGAFGEVWRGIKLEAPGFSMAGAEKEREDPGGGSPHMARAAVATASAGDPRSDEGSGDAECEDEAQQGGEREAGTAEGSNSGREPQFFVLKRLLLEKGSGIRLREHIARFVEAFEMQGKGGSEQWLVFRDEGASLSAVMYTSMGHPGTERRDKTADGKQTGDEGYATMVGPSKWWRDMKAELRDAPPSQRVLQGLLRQ
eukprot:gene24368-29611_t